MSNKNTTMPAEPYKDLYVYLIQGRVTEKYEADLGQTFLGNWVEDNTSLLFFSAPAREKIATLVSKCAELEFIEDYYLTYAQWQRSASCRYRIENFLIVPPWERQKAGKGEIRIVLDPGLVFGTGLHPTTRDCLSALVHLKKLVPLGDVIDLGTGTGILALAAASLGAKRVLAVDLNPLCVKTAVNNVNLNDLAGIVEVATGPAEQFAHNPADLLIANIHFEVIQELLERKIFRKRERLIVSGFMSDHVGKVKTQLKKLRFKVLREWRQDMWCTILAEACCTPLVR